MFGTTVVIVVPVKAKESDGPLYRIRENGKWGYMDRRDSVVIPAQFEHAEDFFEHKAVVSLEGKTGYIDEAGKWQIEPKFLSAGCFKGGVAVAGSLGAQGLIDSTGRFLIDSQFETIEDFSEGFVAVWKAPNLRLDGRVMYVFGGKWGFIRGDASLAIDTEFERVKKFTEGVAAANFGIRYDRRGGIVDEGKWDSSTPLEKSSFRRSLTQLSPFTLELLCIGTLDC